MQYGPLALPQAAEEFLRERHLATLTTARSDGSPHVVAIGFTWDAEHRLVRVITSGRSKKVRNIDAAPGPGAARAVVCQIDGGRWLALEGVARIAREQHAVLEGERRYALRYQEPRLNPDRVVVEIAVDRVLGRA